jgi:hypothetical protein
VLTGEAIHGSMGQRRGTTVVEVDHRSREPARWTVRYKEEKSPGFSEDVQGVLWYK